MDHSFNLAQIVSGLFWVPGGIATIYAIKTAGLAIGIGVGSSFIVLVSFYWGIFVFGEHVHSRIQACVAMACMLCGLAGMAYYSAPTVAHATTTTATVTDVRGEENGRPAIASSNPGPRRGQYRSVRPDDPDFLPPDVDEDAYVSFRELAAANRNGSSTNYVAMEDNEIGGGGDNHDNVNDGTDDEERDLVVVNRREVDETTTNGVASDFSGASHVLCCFGRLSFQRRTLGILSALFSGIYGGSIMAPLKYAPTDCKGLGYLVSFAIGASIVTLTLWIVRFLHLCCRNGGSVQDAYLALPSMHLKKFWLYGGACGLIWSVGNFFSILSVEFLGEGVGYSVTQAVSVAVKNR